jgi:hypothetical protein
VSAARAEAAVTIKGLELQKAQLEERVRILEQGKPLQDTDHAR